MATPGSFPPGWYPDPSGGAFIRWWDGSNWTASTARFSPPVGPKQEPTEPVLPRAAIPRAFGGIAATVVGARVLSLLLRHLAHLPVALYIAVFYLAVFGGLWYTCLTVSRKYATGHPTVDFALSAKLSDIGPAILAYLVAYAAEIFVLSPFVGHTDRIRHLTEGIRNTSTSGFSVFAVAAVVFAPFLEELTFRGMLRRALLARYRPVQAVALQAVVFGLYHTAPGLGWQNVPYVLSLMTVGLVLGYLAQRYQRLGPGICTHVITNSLAVLVLFAYR